MRNINWFTVMAFIMMLIAVARAILTRDLVLGGQVAIGSAIVLALFVIGDTIDRLINPQPLTKDDKDK